MQKVGENESSGPQVNLTPVEEQMGEEVIKDYKNVGDDAMQSLSLYLTENASYEMDKSKLQLTVPESIDNTRRNLSSHNTSQSEQEVHVTPQHDVLNTSDPENKMPFDMHKEIDENFEDSMNQANLEALMQAEEQNPNEEVRVKDIKKTEPPSRYVVVDSSLKLSAIAEEDKDCTERQIALNDSISRQEHESSTTEFLCI